MASLVVHLLAIQVLSVFWDVLSKISVTEQKPQDRAIKVVSMTPEEIKKYRTVGVKNGSKDFSSQVKVPKKQDSVPAAKESIKLGELGSVDTSNVAPPIKKVAASSNQIEKLKPIGDSQAPIEVKATRTKDRYNTLKNMGVADDDAKKLSQTDFDVNFVPPEGISEDELNSAKKIFYSFQKRTYETYVNSFLTTYNSMIRTLPRVRDPLMKERHFLTARVIFDQEGNIMSIRILRSSPNDDIHQLFEKTLRNIRKLPNPPKDLLAKDDTFTIYYQLKVN